MRGIKCFEFCKVDSDPRIDNAEQVSRISPGQHNFHEQHKNECKEKTCTGRRLNFRLNFHRGQINCNCTSNDGHTIRVDPNYPKLGLAITAFQWKNVTSSHM